jgi:basic amino acid/polyamine antiporter, APA family
MLDNLFRKKSIYRIQADAASGLSDAEGGTGLRRELKTLDLTALGIAAIIGAGIFSMIGTAAHAGGPAVVFLFVFTAVACGFSAMCYAEFASRIPIAGSAYTYAYASLGEIVAWIIGWDLLMEYAIGNIAVAISWSDYFTGLLAGYGLHVPDYLTMNFVTASRGHDEIAALLSGGQTIDAIRAGVEHAAALAGYDAWLNAPLLGGFHVVCDIPALIIVFTITTLVFVGIRESKRVSNAMVAIKIAVILLVIGLGAFYVNPKNWTPFAPNGVGGVLKGVSGVFFAYIGFDAISTTAEECRDPQRDLPRGMILSLIICTVLYILVALVLTGMMSYKDLAVGDPLAFVFGPAGANLPWISGIIALSAVIAMTTVLLVFQLGQPRIWMAMSRDGLLPPIFSAIHPRFKTPWFSTIVTGLVVGIPSMFLNLTEVTDLTSIGTLFAFLIVSGGVLFLDRDDTGRQGRFHLPYVNGRYAVPALFVCAVGGLAVFAPFAVCDFFCSDAPFGSKVPMMVYWVFFAAIAVLSFVKSLSLIPVMGLLTCGYLMTELGTTNWIRFGAWLLVGLSIYFLYSRKRSRLGRAGTTSSLPR